MLLLLTWLLATSEVLYHPPPLASTGPVAVSENKMDKLIETLKRHEGVKTRAYQDPMGTWHIGVGRNIHPEGPTKHLNISFNIIRYITRYPLTHSTFSSNITYHLFY